MGNPIHLRVLCMRCRHEAVVDAFSTIRGYEALVAGVRSYWFRYARQGINPTLIITIPPFISLLRVRFASMKLVTAVTAILLFFCGVGLG